MAYYLLLATFTSESWAALAKNPQDPRVRHEAMMKNVGGTMESYWFTFGDYDVATIIQVPDNVTAAAISIAASAAGGVKAVKTIPLMTVEEGIAALRKVPATGYRPPS